MNQKLLITAISVALMGTAGMVTNAAYAAPKNPTAIEASCKNNAEKKSWCQSEEPVPNQNESGDSEGSEGESEEVTGGDENTPVSEEENSDGEIIGEENTSESEEENSDGETTDVENTEDNSTTETEVTPESENTPPTDEEIEALLKQAEELGILEDSDALIVLLAENGISSENLTEEQKEALPITWDLPAPPPTEEGESEETEEGESEEAEEGESEEAEEGESEEAEEGESEEETVTESLEPEDVNESTFSEVISEQEEQLIQTQLETVDEVVLLDEEGNEIVVPVAEKEVIGEVLIPRDEDEGSANAMIDGVLLDVEVTFGVAEATLVNSAEANEEESVILTTVTGLEMNAPTETAQEEVNTDKLITLQADETGNYILYLPELKVGELVVNVKLRAVTETLDTYQVEEVTIAPKDVFGAEAQEAEEEAQEAEAESQEEAQEVEAESQEEAQEVEAESQEEAQEVEAESQEEAQEIELEGI